MMAGVIQAAPVTPPLDARGKKDVFNIVYNLKELNLPFIFSSVHTNPNHTRRRGAQPARLRLWLLSRRPYEIPAVPSQKQVSPQEE